MLANGLPGLCSPIKAWKIVVFFIARLLYFLCFECTLNHCRGCMYDTCHKTGIMCDSEKGVQRTVKSAIFETGSRVRVTSYCPFRGLTGTVRTVDVFPHGSQPYPVKPHCFYLIDLEGSFIKEPVWFENEEVESVSLHEHDILRSA